jgi:hypothetical protein
MEDSIVNGSSLQKNCAGDTYSHQSYNKYYVKSLRLEEVAFEAGS